MTDEAPPPLCEHCGLPVPRARRDNTEAARFCCIGCRLVHHIHQQGPEISGETHTPINPLFLRLGVGIFLTMNIMGFNHFFLARYVFKNDIPPGQEEAYRLLAGLFAYLIMFLCTIVMVVLGVPIARDSLVGLATRRRLRLDTGLLITIGVFAAFVLSVLHTLRGEGPLYFDTAAMILVLVTLGSYLESGAKLRAARDAYAFFNAIPSTARVKRDDQAVQISTTDILPGDRVIVLPGETIPVDGQITEGRAHVDESSLTGESQPRPLAPGDRVLAGSISVDGLIHLTATSTGDDRTISRMRELLERARAEQPHVQRAADQISAIFVPAVVVLAVALFVWWWRAGDAATGLMTALSVLLISCPCALGLSAPLATWSALGRAARRGILIGSGAVLERAASVRHVFFDKTGTLTTSQMRIVKISPAHGVSEEEALTLAAAVESGSTHPVARAIVAAAHDRGIHPPLPGSLTVIPGVGVEANVNGRVLRIGNAAGLKITEPHADAGPVLVESGRVLARFILAEQVRDGAKACLTRLSTMGVGVCVLTGDQATPAGALARELGVAVQSQLLPGDKLHRLTSWRAEHARGAVAMIGDGINDAPVLAAADVGIAIGGGADLARQAGNVHLISDNLARVPDFFALARHAHLRIRLSLAWAFGYNAVGIALAATGRLSPIFAASAMVLSSLVVVFIAKGAGRFEEEPTPEQSIARTPPQKDNTAVAIATEAGAWN